jgi:hypothetical protein
MEPFNENDLLAIEEMLGKAESGVIPSTAKVQLLEIFNTLMPKTLN